MMGPHCERLNDGMPQAMGAQRRGPIVRSPKPCL